MRNEYMPFGSDGPDRSAPSQLGQLLSRLAEAGMNGQSLVLISHSSLAVR